MVKTVPITEPERFAGHWYKHRHSGLKTLNQFVDHIPLNRTGLAFTNIPATGMLLHISQYNSVNDTDCVYRLFLGLFGHNGQCPGKALSSVDSDIPVTNNINMLYVDYDRVTIAYICRSTNYKTGFCDHPVFHVLTRARPDKMPAKELKAIDDLVDQTLAPYCLTAADVDPQMYSDARPFCKPADLGDTCAFRAMTALTEDINNSTQYQYKEIKP
ncbi:uncharacterized protein LOC129598436 [Paramacrobiotus metropolitanus]|uniref:uncharacterized protein LOC129598436 n=1 Tax=Paramacrobiotus metropolitanus TaxID=2943436 RepID=UPI00244586ED|nr:uncharacterized protein LOC129598436 [Paramacrobiotus metropolitanus]